MSPIYYKGPTNCLTDYKIFSMELTSLYLIVHSKSHFETLSLERFLNQFNNLCVIVLVLDTRLLDFKLVVKAKSLSLDSKINTEHYEANPTH